MILVFKAKALLAMFGSLVLLFLTMIWTHDAFAVGQLVLPKPRTLEASVHRAGVKLPGLVLPKPHTLEASAHRAGVKLPGLVLPKPRTLEASAHRAGVKLPELVLPKPRTLGASAHRAGVKVPELVLPKPHTLEASVHRAGVKVPELVLPKPHTLEVAVVRKGQAEPAITGRVSDLSGCWDEYTKVKRGGGETHSEVTIEQREGAIQIKAKDKVYRGRINGASVHVQYRPEKISDIMRNWWDDNGNPMPAPSREVLSQAVKMLGHMPVYTYDLTIVDRDHMSGTFTALHVDWEGENKKKVTAARQSQWPDRMVRRKGRIQSLRFTGPSWKAINSVLPSGRVRIEAMVEPVCKVGLQSMTVQVYKKSAGENTARRVLLLESTPGSGVLRSTADVSVASMEARPGDAIIVRAGLRGASLPVVGTAKGPQG